MGYADRQIRGSIGYFMGRPNSGDQLTIAFLGENEDMVCGLAAMLRDIGPENLRVAFEPLEDGSVQIVIEDKRDPSNFNDCRKPPVELIARFLDELDEDLSFVITVGDYELNMSYDKLTFTKDNIEINTPKYLN